MTKLIAYHRVSTTKQGQSGLGLDSQKEIVREYAKRTNGNIIGSFTEVESGSKDNRPELQTALRECRLKGATLVIAKLDRLSRNRNFLLMMDDSSINFVCCDMPEANKLTIGLMACMADYERQLISERTKAALAQAKKRGVKLGNPKLNQVRNTDTSKAVKAAAAKTKKINIELKQVVEEFKETAKENLSLRKIAQLLNDAGYRTVRGGQFRATTVNRILSVQP